MKTRFSAIFSPFIIFATILYSNELSVQQKYEDARKYINSTVNTVNSNNNTPFHHEINKHINSYLSRDNTDITVIFYFIDSQVDEVSLQNFSIGIDRLRSNNINVVGKIMFRGLINNSFEESFAYVKKLEDRVGKNIEFYPIHFHSFKYFKLDRVPAYAISQCNNDNFAFNECKHKYLLSGNIGLKSLFEIIVESDSSYKLHYDTLRESNANAKDIN